MGLNVSNINPVLRTIVRNLPRVARAQGFDVRVTSGYRSRAVQTKLYNEYISGRAQYPANPPGMSAHEYGRAIDVLSTNTEALVALLTSVGLVWAGPNDPIHFELPPNFATGSRRTKKVTPVKVVTAPKKKSLAKKVLGAASWVPGPVGIAATVLDFIF